MVVRLAKPVITAAQMQAGGDVMKIGQNITNKFRPGISLSFTFRVSTNDDGVLLMELVDENGRTFEVTHIKFADGTEFRRLDS